jgi:hypothetical protein
MRKPKSTTSLPTTTTILPVLIEEENSTEVVINGTTSLEDLLINDLLNEIESTTTQSIPHPTFDTSKYKIQLKPPPDHYNQVLNSTNDQFWISKMAATTEFLANELNATLLSTQQQQKRKRGRKNKKRRKFNKTTTTPEPAHQIPPTDLYQEPTTPMQLTNITLEDSTNKPLEPESYGTDTLDALLVYLPEPKVPAGMISWTARIPFRMAYFGFTVIEGNLGKQKRLKEKGQKRAKGVRIYVKGLEMPIGYTQVTQVQAFLHDSRFL